MVNERKTKAQRELLYREVYDVYQARPDFSYERLARMFELNSRAHAFWIVQKMKLREKKEVRILK